MVASWPETRTRFRVLRLDAVPHGKIVIVGTRVGGVLVTGW
ncbi:MAG TPA: hypothetical protein VH210_07370 [Gaiellaceae bacterium]|jgi:hypothetical protein|nr:hypothetical protein [Gaiellaceae bacterium]